MVASKFSKNQRFKKSTRRIISPKRDMNKEDAIGNILLDTAAEEVTGGEDTETLKK